MKRPSGEGRDVVALSVPCRSSFHEQDRVQAIGTIPDDPGACGDGFPCDSEVPVHCREAATSVVCGTVPV